MTPFSVFYVHLCTSANIYNEDIIHSQCWSDEGFSDISRTGFYDHEIETIFPIIKSEQQSLNQNVSASVSGTENTEYYACSFVETNFDREEMVRDILE